MYLSNATGLDEIITYGLKPLIELMNILEDEILDDMEPGSKEYILWLEMKGKALKTREVAERIYQADVAKRKHTRNKTALSLNNSNRK